MTATASATAPRSTTSCPPRLPDVKAAANVSEQVERLGETYENSIAELHLYPERIRRVVDTALDLAHQMPLKARPTAQGDLPTEFDVPVMTGEWVRATDGLLTPFVPQGEAPYQRPVTFDPLVAQGRDDVVLAHLSHPLVDMSARLLRAADSDRVDLHRVTAVVGPDDLEDTFVAAYAKYTLTGGDSTQLHQEIMAVGGWLDSRIGRFRRLENLTRTAEILDDALDRGKEAGPGARLRLAEHWTSGKTDSLMLIRSALYWGPWTCCPC
ncbi:hypothetical protein [Glycomyces tarimensis]